MELAQSLKASGVHAALCSAVPHRFASLGACWPTLSAGLQIWPKHPAAVPERGWVHPAGKRQ